MTNAGKTVLIIEDNIDFHILTKVFLVRNGFEVRSLFDGKTQDVFTFAAGCDVILLDVDLPSQSGAEISRQLKTNAETSQIPVIMMTGNAEGESICLQAGADACLIKPFPSANLLDRLQEMLKVKIPFTGIANA
jgi:DNA-binding response OmpR family regulator